MSKKIRFKYVFPRDYNPSHANGAFGGIGPRGDIILNFFYDRPPVPYETIQDADGDYGNLGKTVSLKPEDFESLIIRYVTGGVSLCYEDAVSLRDFLNIVIKQLDELKEGKND